jgi:U4/U6.U5 tri-snRNP-associated protein 2
LLDTATAWPPPELWFTLVRRLPWERTLRATALSVHMEPSAKKRRRVGDTAVSDASEQQNARHQTPPRHGQSAAADTPSGGTPCVGPPRAADAEADAAAEAPAAAAAEAADGPLLRPGTQCPYMHTVNRHALDFDFEKVCSVSLAAHNVYACLVCGKYFQGRGPASHAFAHALDVGHHLFLNLQSERAYCLPDGYAVADPALETIARVLRPRFHPSDVAALDAPPPRYYRTLDGARQLQGVTPLDNLHHCSDYANVIFQMLITTVTPLRNVLLLAPCTQNDHSADRMASSRNGCAMAHPANGSLSSNRDQGNGRVSDHPVHTPAARLLHELCVLAKKIWTPLAFRAHISPHEIMQQVSNASNRRFGPLHQADPVDFLAWLMHTLHRQLATGTPPLGIPPAGMSSRRLLQECLQGSLEITTIRDGRDGEEAEVVTKKLTNFWFLTLDLPPKPLFKDTSERTLVAQVPLMALLSKYDGVSRHHVVKTGERRSYRLTQLPPFLVMTIKRVTRTNFAVEKNPAVVLCPVAGLDLSDLCPALQGADATKTTYSLASVIVHDGPHDKGSYRIAVRHLATGKWFGLQNVNVTEVLPQLFSLGETSILLYARDEET